MKCLHKLKVRVAAYSGLIAYVFVDSLGRRSRYGAAAFYQPKMDIWAWVSKYVTDDEFDEIFPPLEPDGTQRK